MNVFFKRFSSKAHRPKKFTNGSAGYNLVSARNIVIAPDSTLLIESSSNIDEVIRVI